MKRLLLLLALTGFVPFAARAQPAPGGPPAVGVVRAERQQITQTDEFIGRIQAMGEWRSSRASPPFLRSGNLSRVPRSKRATSSISSSNPPFKAQVDADEASVAQLEAQHLYAEQQLARGSTF